MNKTEVTKKYLERHAKKFKKRCPYCKNTLNLNLLKKEFSDKTYLCPKCNKKWVEVYGWIEMFTLKEVILDME